MLEEHQCHITAYLKNIIYLDSPTRGHAELEEIRKRISPANTFSLSYHEDKHVSPYYAHIAKYLMLVAEHHSPKYAHLGGQVEMSTRQSALFISAPEVKVRLALKNSCKKYIQEMTVLVVKPKFEQKALKSYLKRVVDYPFVVEVVGKTMVIITKDHIVSKLFSKDKFVAQVLGSGNRVGLFVMRQRQDASKEDVVRKLADELDYRVVAEDSVMYFVGDITTESERRDEQNNFALFMQKFIANLSQTNEKFSLTLDLLKLEDRRREE